MDVVHLFGIRFVIASCALKNTIPRYWSRILVALPFSSFGFIISYFFLYCSSFSLSLSLFLRIASTPVKCVDMRVKKPLFFLVPLVAF